MIRAIHEWIALITARNESLTVVTTVTHKFLCTDFVTDATRAPKLSAIAMIVHHYWILHHKSYLSMSRTPLGASQKRFHGLVRDQHLKFGIDAPARLCCHDSQVPIKSTSRTLEGVLHPRLLMTNRAHRRGHDLAICCPPQSKLIGSISSSMESMLPHLGMTLESRSR